MSAPPPSAVVAPPRRRIVAFVAGALLPLIGLALLNFLVNPLGYYPTRLVPPLAWSSRRLKLDLIEKAQPTGVIVLGSSRAMMMPPPRIQATSGLTAFNAAVDSARAEDWLALYRFVTEGRGWHPRELVLGIDVEAFHDHLEPDGRLFGESRLRGLLPTRMRVEGIGHIAGALVSFDQVRSSVRALLLLRHGFPPDASEFGADGAFVRNAADTEDGGGPDSAQSLQEYLNRFAGYQHPETERLGLFDELLARADRDGVRVRAFITPLADRVRGELIRQRRFTALHAELLDWLTAARARHPSLTVLDATDVRAVGGDPRDFYDGAHVRIGNAEKIVDALYAPGPGQRKTDAVQ